MIVKGVKRCLGAIIFYILASFIGPLVFSAIIHLKLPIFAPPVVTEIGLEHHRVDLEVFLTHEAVADAFHFLEVLAEWLLVWEPQAWYVQPQHIIVKWKDQVIRKWLSCF